MKYLLVSLFAIILSGCVVHPHGHRNTHREVKVVTVLDKEHNDKAIVVINARPAANRKCWSHGAHWHCKR